MSHGVMLSDPPTRPTSSGTLLHKGVMLSLRPASSIVDPHGRGGPNINPPPFITGGHGHDQIGYPPIPNPALVFQRKRITAMGPAMRKHRRWLDDLRLERQRIQDERRHQQSADEVRLRNFKERSAFVRRRVCEAIKGGGNELTAEEAEKLFTAPLSELKRMQQQQQQQKPAWSMTEQEGEMIDRSQVEDLVTFTQQLDIGRYIDDLEIQQLVRNVQKRIADLDRSGDFRSETEAARARRLALPDHHNNVPNPIALPDNKETTTLEDIDDEGDPEDNVERLLDELLPNFKGIHSRTSLRNVIDSIERRPSSCLESTGARDLDVADLPAPRIVEVDGNHVGRIPADKQAAHISTLPYLHRNPAV